MQKLGTGQDTTDATVLHITCRHKKQDPAQGKCAWAGN